jgi:hypothetical protein
VHAEGGTVTCLGVPDTLGEQAHRHRRSSGAGPRANEPAERARLSNMARLSAAHAELAAVTVD